MTLIPGPVGRGIVRASACYDRRSLIDACQDKRIGLFQMSQIGLELIVPLGDLS
jgi:hypothetical protein